MAVNKLLGWNNPKIPGDGWQCVDLVILACATHKCVMCGNERVRFVHVVKHPKYPRKLSVGCICAGHMTGDPAAAKGRETIAKGRASRLVRWRKRGWRISQKGNPYIIVRGYLLVVFPSRDKMNRWKFVSGGEISEKDYKTAEDAKLAAFIDIEQHLYPLPGIS